MAASGAELPWIESLRASEEVSQLVYALTLADRFYFAIVVCEGPRVADAVLDALVDRVSDARGAEIRLVRLDPYAGYERLEAPIPFERVVDKVLGRLLVPAPGDRSPEVVFVVDASRARPDDYAWGAMFQRMNERRNTIVKGLGVPLLLCLPSWLEPVFARRAPDFWSISSLAVVVKATPPVEAGGGQRRAGAPAPESAPGPIHGLLPSEDLRAIHAAAIMLGLPREPLLAGIDPSLVASLPHGASAAIQLLLDLDWMSRIERLSDGTIPLERWLQNAARLANDRREAAVFLRALAALSALSSPAPGAPPRVAISRLAATSKVLFGRDADLAWLDDCWENGTRVASVIAFAGVGKTALVNTWLARLDRDGWRGARRVFGWSFYSQGTDHLSSSDEFLAAALRWFGEPDMGPVSAWDKGERLAEVVGRERSLLVLDGVEPLQWGPGVQEGRFKDQGLEALLKGLGAQNSGMCLVMSRIGLADLKGVGGDKVVTRDLRFLEPEAGADLLRSRGVVGTHEELVAAAREYKGHGLALTLLGSYLADVAEGDVRRRHEIGPLQGDERRGEHARRVMAKYEGWLGKPELAILHMMGLFDRPADEREVSAVRAEPSIPGLTDALVGVGTRGWNQALGRLRRAGLLLPEEPDRRLDAHPLVREHFGEQLRKEQPDAWREGHRRLYEHLKASAKELPETIEEMRPLYAAVVHGCLAGMNQEALDSVYWKRIQRGDESFNSRKLGAFGTEVATLSAFFDPPWERLAPGLTDSDGAWVLNEVGYALRALGRLSDAAGLMRLSLEMGIAQQDWQAAARRAANLSELLQSHGDLGEALARARTSVDLADRSGDAGMRMITRTETAAVLHALGRSEEAAAQFEEAEQMQKERQPAYPRLYSVQGFQYCDLLLDQGRDAEVRERAALTIGWEAGRLLDVALDHLSLGRAHLLAAQRDPAADLTPAASHLTQAVDGLRRAGQQDNLPLGLLARAALHTHTRAFPLAHKDLAESLTLTTRCGFRLHLVDTHLAYTRLHLAESAPDRTAARSHLAAASSLIATTGYHRRDPALAALAAQIPPEASSADR